MAMKDKIGLSAKDLGDRPLPKMEPRRFVVKNKDEARMLYNAFIYPEYIEVYAIDPPRCALIMCVQESIDFFDKTAGA